MRVSISIAVFILCSSLPVSGQSDTLAFLFRSSYEVFKLQRNDLGIYRDSKLFSGVDYHPASTANIGMGLVSLCIADAMGWEPDAAGKVITTLKSLAGYNQPFRIDRNASGFFRHFVDMETGVNQWDSEYSTIETALVMSGALFCREYFDGNEDIARYTRELWDGINWSKAIADPLAGDIYLTMDVGGNGIAGSVTKPYNEYMIVAWLAMNSEGNAGGPATQLWNKHFADPANLPRKTFLGVEVLTDNPDHFLSSFTFQFPYYLCHYFTTDERYLRYFDQARQADSLWWDQLGTGASWEWGIGAGSASTSGGYRADAVNNNPDRNVSPHIVGGFLPAYPAGAEDLKRMYRDKKLTYKLPPNGAYTILWRKSLKNTQWSAPEVQGVDYSSMLFGLATLPQFLGPDFFSKYNDFNFFTTGLNPIEEATVFEVYPSPASDRIHFNLDNEVRDQVALRVFDLEGKVWYERPSRKDSQVLQGEIPLGELPAGMFILEVRAKGWKVSRAFNKQ